jgi:uncharacterized membrane protein
MKYLLANRFKKMGSFIAPIGFLIWLCMQFGFITKLLILLFGEDSTEQSAFWYHQINVVVATISFFAFLAGIYFITFSKEKIEDEMVERTRLESFQFAAIFQLLFIIVGFLSMFILGDPNEGGLMLFFIALIFAFWLSFICRFNYILHFKMAHEK